MLPMALSNETTIRPLTKGDAKILFNCVNSNREHLRQWFPWVSETKKLEDTIGFLNAVEEQHKNSSGLHFGIFDSKTEKLHGCVGFREIRHADNTAVIGFWLAAESEGKGIAGAACRKLVDHGKSMGIKRFEIHTAINNTRAQKLAKNLEFKRVPGVINSAEIVNSKFVDHVVFVLEDNISSNEKKSATYFLKRGSLFSLCIGVVIAALMISNPDPASSSNGLQGKHLLLVGGPWNATVQGFWFTTSRQAGLEISIADKPGHWTQSAASTALVYSFHPVNMELPTSQLVEELVNIILHSGVEFDGILTLKDTYLVAVAEATNQTGLPTVSDDVFRQLRDKETLRKKTKSNIHSYRIKQEGDLKEASRLIGFPAVLKPVQGEGSLGVHHVTSHVELTRVYRMIRSKLPTLSSILGDIPDLLLEEYINGTEHNVEMIIQNGRALFAAVSDDLLGELPWFQEAGQTFTSKLQCTVQEMLVKYAIEVCKQLEMSDGVVHIELKFTENAPQLIEVNARMGGLYTWHGVKTIWGVDLLLHSYEIALGETVSSLPNRGSIDACKHNPTVFAVARYPNAPYTGYILRKDFLDPYTSNTNLDVTYAFPAVNIGQKVYGPEDDRPFWLAMFQVVGKESLEKTEEIADEIVKDMNISSIISKTAAQDILSVASTPVIGMTDIFGLQRRKYHTVSRTLESVAYRFGYDEILMPLLERATSFSEGIVGQSPWPEWDPRGCFFFEITDYSNGFTNEVGKTPVVLIPEGTISVARWLGLQISSNPNLVFPLKIFYNVPCFRNEPIDTLSERKKRQFDQFGIEILGTQNLGADAEIIWMMGDMLEALGIPKSNMIVRVSNIQILIHLLNDSGVAHPDDIKIKEAMDEMAECRAKGANDCVKKNAERFWNVLNKYALTNEIKTAWTAMLQHESGVVNDELRSQFPESYKSLFDELEIISTQLVKHNLKVIADLCVVRSHEYYTHFSFEVDIRMKGRLYLEIAGGGRYNKLVGHFIDKANTVFDDRKYMNVVPSTGFAFGMQRLIAMLEEIGIFHDHLLRPSTIVPPLDDSTADILLIPNVTRTNQVESYLDTHKWLSDQEDKFAEGRYDIYLGDRTYDSARSTANSEDAIIDSYKRKRNIKAMINVQ